MYRVCPVQPLRVKENGTAKYHVLLLIQINYPYIDWNNVPEFHSKKNTKLKKIMHKNVKSGENFLKIFF